MFVDVSSLLEFETKKANPVECSPHKEETTPSHTWDTHCHFSIKTLLVKRVGRGKSSKAKERGLAGSARGLG